MLNKETNHKRRFVDENIEPNKSIAYNNPNRPNSYLGLEGKRFGKIVLTKFIGFEEKNQSVIYMYKCDCGNIGICYPSVLFREIKKDINHLSTCGSCPSNYFELIDENTIVGYTDLNNVFILDIVNFNDLNIFQFNWAFSDQSKNDNNRYYILSSGYNHRIKNKVSNKQIRLHSYIMGLHNTTTKLCIDHIHNNKGYDNRRQNLRVTTVQQNAFNMRQFSTNTTGTTGVYYDKDKKCKKPWYARIRIDGKHMYLGNFNTKEEAIEVRKEAEIKYFGEYLHDPKKLKEEDKSDEIIQLLYKRNFINEDGSQNTDIIKEFIESHNFKYLKLNQIESFDSSNVECDLPIIKI